MDLILQQNNKHTTLVNAETQEALYDIDSSSQFFKGACQFTISKVKGDDISVEVAKIETHAFSKDSVTLRGEDITPKLVGKFTTTRAFTASNGKEYMWRWPGFQKAEKEYRLNPLTLVRGKSAEDLASPLAYWDAGALRLFGKGRPESLRVEKEGLDILDEIVATFFYARRDWINSQAAIAAS